MVQPEYKWTPTQIDILKDNYGKLSLETIAKIIHRKTDSVKTKAKSLGLIPPSYRGWKKEQDDFLINNKGKMTYREMGKLIGKSGKAVNKRAWELGITESLDKRVLRTCIMCGKTFLKKRDRIIKRGGKFCSTSCSTTHHAKLRKEKLEDNGVCANCGKGIRIPPCHLNRPQRFFCSRDCSNEFGGYTYIENLMKNELDRRGIKYTPFKKLVSHYHADFFIEPNIIIECDGDYWHSLPHSKERDANKDITCSLLGYKLFRFRGKQIKRNVESCVNQVFGVNNNLNIDKEIYN